MELGSTRRAKSFDSKGMENRVLIAKHVGIFELLKDYSRFTVEHLRKKHRSTNKFP